MIGPTWSDAATKARQIERRDVTINATGKFFLCPFCEAMAGRRLLDKVTGHRCGCGALFYTQQPVAIHFKERE